MLNSCDIYIPSTCFGIENMKIYNSFEELPKRRGYGVVFYDKKEENLLKSKNIEWGKISEYTFFSRTFRACNACPFDNIFFYNIE